MLSLSANSLDLRIRSLRAFLKFSCLELSWHFFNKTRFDICFPSEIPDSAFHFSHSKCPNATGLRLLILG